MSDQQRDDRRKSQKEDRLVGWSPKSQPRQDGVTRQIDRFGPGQPSSKPSAPAPPESAPPTDSPASSPPSGTSDDSAKADQELFSIDEFWPDSLATPNPDPDSLIDEIFSEADAAQYHRAFIDETSEPKIPAAVEDDRPGEDFIRGFQPRSDSAVRTRDRKQTVGSPPPTPVTASEFTSSRVSSDVGVYLPAKYAPDVFPDGERDILGDLVGSSHGWGQSSIPLDGPDTSRSPSSTQPYSVSQPPRESLAEAPLPFRADDSLAGFRSDLEAYGLELGVDPKFERLAEAILFVRTQLKDLAKIVEAQIVHPGRDLHRKAEEIADLKDRIDRLEEEVRARAAVLKPLATPESPEKTNQSDPISSGGFTGVSSGLHETSRETGHAQIEAPWGKPPSEIFTENLEESALLILLGSRRQQTDTHQIDRFLRLLVQRGASDLHFTVGCAPMFRVAGDIEPLRYRLLRSEDWHRMIKPITNRRVWDQFERTGDVDFAYEIPSVGRFRVNLFRQHRGEGAVFRVIPDKILTIEQLGMPRQLHRVAKIPGGLVLVTGPTGSGKSTTLAAIINEINETQSYHIITLEDPIEFVHPNKRSIIHQREIGTHTNDFAAGLRDAIREDPNLLLVGEMRDLETIRLALESAAKGLLVFATLHTNNAAKTVDRIINVFPTREQDTIRSVLADTVRAILAQQLVKRTDGGLVAAVEILFGSPALSNLIREAKTHQVTNLVQTGRRQGMISMDDALLELVQKGLITTETAFEKAIDRTLFRDPEQARLEEEALSTAQAEQSRPAPAGTE